MTDTRRLVLLAAGCAAAAAPVYAGVLPRPFSYLAARAEGRSPTLVFRALLSLRRALRRGEARWLAAGFAALAAGLACKETAAAVPAVALAWALFLLPASDLRARRALWISLAV